MENMLKSYKQFLSADPYSREGKYWLDKLSGEWVKTTFPNDYTAPDLKTGDRQTVNIKFPGEISHHLIKLANQSDFRLHILLVSGLTLLLHTYSGNREIILGTPVLKQDNDANFINTVLVLKNPIKESITFKDLLLQTRREIIETTENQNYPLEALPYQLNWNIPDNDFPLFDVTILLENIHEKKYLQHLETNLGMIFIFSRSGQCLEGSVEYNPALYEKAAVERIGRHFSHLLGQGIFNLDILVSHIHLVSLEEKQKILYEFNNTGASFPRAKTLHGLFQQQVDRAPYKVTLVYRDSQISYGELNRKANQLAYFLKSTGVMPDDILGLMIPGLMDMSIGILGILKAGSAYLPIDTGYPPERIKNILEDSGINRLVGDRTKGRGDWGDGQHTGLELIDIRDSAVFNNDGPSPEDSVKCTDAAYVIYTSGTTGRPKGIVVAHANAVNTLVYRKQEYCMNEDNTALQLFSYAFDGFVTGFFTPLIAVVKLILADEAQIKDMWEMKEIIVKNCVTHFISIPILYEAILEVLTPKEAKMLKTVTLAGEKLSLPLLEETGSKGKDIEIVNEYGVTEAAVMSTIFRHQEKEKRITIGHPIANTAIYILDRCSRLMPIGAPGELCIAGAGVARGYLNNPELTAEKFDLDLWDLQDYHDEKLHITKYKLQTNHKLQNTNYRQEINHKLLRRGRLGGEVSRFLEKSPPGRRKQKIYKTGDLARWLPDGNIEYIGRIDSQVKVSGFRIELGEIEHQLMKHEIIKNAVVTANESSNQGKYLCAYIITRSSSSEKSSLIPQLKQYLSINLPGYMIPAYFVELDQLPLTPNGKIDRKRLPEPETGGLVEYIAPRNDIEEILAKVWKEVLRAEKVGIHHNFFDLGGDSIKSIQIAARLQTYGLEVKVRDLFSNPTIGQLVHLVKGSELIIDQGIVQGDVEFTPAHLWFLENNSLELKPFNQSVMLYRKDGFDETILENVFTRILEHHDALRMVFTCEGNSVTPKIRGIEGKLFHLEILHLDEEHTDTRDMAEKIQKQAGRIQHSIDVKTGPPVRLGLFKTPYGDHLLIAIHHFVIDGVSWRILFEDLALGLQQAEKGVEIVFQSKTHSFQYWAAQLNRYAHSKAALEEIHFWKKAEEIKPGDYKLPLKHQLEEKTKILENSRTITMVLEEEETTALLQEVHQAYNTQINDVLLTALALAVNRWKGIEKVTVSLEGHGREEIIHGIDISRTIGWFTAEYPVVLDMTTSRDPAYLVKVVKETLRKVPNKGIGYGILKYLTPGELTHELHFSLEPQIGFNYLGQYEQEMIRDGDHSNKKIFEFSSLNGGINIGPDFHQEVALQINGMTAVGKMQFTFIYNKHVFEKDDVQSLVNLYKANLIEIIRHCRQKEESELTPSDVVVDQMELSLEDLDEIQKLTGNIEI